MITPLTTTPRSLIAGDSVAWNYSSSAFSSSEWSLSFLIGTLIPRKIVGTVNANGSWDFTLSSQDTAQILPGTYNTTYVFSEGTNRASMPADTLTILPDPTGVRRLSWAAETLDAVEKALLSLAKSTVSTVSIDGQTYTKQNISTLRAFKSELDGIVAMEQGYAFKITGRRKVVTRFTDN